MRFISNLIALLIIVAVVVGASVGIGLTIASVMQRSSPRAVDVSLSCQQASISGSTLLIKLYAVVSGSEPVEITNVKVYKGTSEITYTSKKVYLTKTLMPGCAHEIVINLSGVSDVYPTDVITVTVFFQGVKTGVQGISKCLINVES